MSFIDQAGQDTGLYGTHGFRWLRPGNPAQVERLLAFQKWMQSATVGGIKVIYVPDAVCVWTQVMRLHQDAVQLSIVADPPDAPAIARALLVVLEMTDTVTMTMTEAAVKMEKAARSLNQNQIDAITLRAADTFHRATNGVPIYQYGWPVIRSCNYRSCNYM